MIDPTRMDWTPCTPECRHHGPFAVTYMIRDDADCAPDRHTFFVDERGSTAGYAFLLPPAPIRVDAPHR